jgi:hypothetical protein
MGKLRRQTVAFLDTAPYRVSADFDSPASANRVFEVLADHRGGVKWIGTGITSIVPTATPETGVGCTRTLNFLYGVAQLREEFIEWDEGKVWSFTATAMRPKLCSSFVESFSLRSLGNDGCRIHYRAGIDLSWPMKPFAGSIVEALTRRVPTVLKNLSETAEAP